MSETTALIEMVKAHNATERQIQAFEFITSDKLNQVSSDCVRTYYHIGRFLVNLAESNSQSEAKSIREQYFTGKGKLMTNNEFTGCKKLAEKFSDASDAVKAYTKTGKRSMNAARIWAALRDEKKTTEKTPFELIKQARETLDKIVHKYSDKVTDEKERKDLAKILNADVVLAEAKKAVEKAATE